MKLQPKNNRSKNNHDLNKIRKRPTVYISTEAGQWVLQNFSDDTDGSEIPGAKDGATPAAPDRNILSEHHSAQVNTNFTEYSG